MSCLRLLRDDLERINRQPIDFYIKSILVKTRLGLFRADSIRQVSLKPLIFKGFLFVLGGVVLINIT